MQYSAMLAAFCSELGNSELYSEWVDGIKKWVHVRRSLEYKWALIHCGVPSTSQLAHWKDGVLILSLDLDVFVINKTFGYHAAASPPL